MARSSSTPDSSQPIDDLAERCAALLRLRPSALLSDIDGTLAPIAPTPELAAVDPVGREALTRLSRTVDVVGVITGRRADDAAAMLDLPWLLAIGNHGYEWREHGVTRIDDTLASYADDITAALDSVGRRLQALGLSGGVLIEDKRYTGSIHYRLSDRPDETAQVIRSLAQEEAARRGLIVSEGRMVVELRPPLVVNKGTALTSLVTERDLRAVIFFGDDVTDVDAFLAATTLRESCDIEALSVAVVSDESPESVRAAADAMVWGVSECVELLQRVARLLEGAAAGG